ncbi:MFS transporter [Cytobacillus kochii]|uniref:MFS transporter n=1 Tax=Cytobacillus kochii TaxID=859143 RepID=UPI001CD6B944|nr:MFS transporter [Cytobacillus kochii]MCA1025823.1 MFS transporter [Cytobacillus kochii]MCM3321577.1 MFS transporter [Cytobacillus kochii]MCM3343589.1 MFS transporter [Cytobacillus kochii]MDM5207420.1 MFS transporter [Cytobacillus kochii]
MLTGKKRWLYIAVPIFFFWFFGQIDKLGISIIQTDADFLSDLGIAGENAKIGFITFIFTIAYAVSNLFWGVIIDKLGARKTAMLGLVVWTITMITAGLSTTYEMFILSRIVLGFGEGMMIPVCGKFIANWFHYKELGKAQASWLSGNYLGPAVGALMLTAIIASLHWQAAFFLLAAFNLLLVLPLFYFLTRDIPEEHKGITHDELSYIREKNPVDKKDGSKNFAQDYRYWIVWFGMLMSSFLFFGISIWLPTYLIEAKSFSREAMSSITSLSWLFALGFVLICGYLSDKTNRPSLMATILFVLTTIFLCGGIMSPNAIVAGICMGLAMGTQGGVFHLSNLFIVKFSTPETAGRAAGMMGFTNIMGGFASYIMGYLRDLSNGDFGTSIIVLIFASTLGFVAYLFTLKRESTELRVVHNNQSIVG